MTFNSIFQIFSDNNPNPATELEYVNAFTLLVAVVLSAQSTDAGVNKATKPLFEKYDSPEKMIELGEEGLKSYVKTIGLYNNKAKNIISISRILVEQYNSEVPGSMDDLLKLPGVGRKSANVILSCAFGKVTMPVDTHVFRVSKRIGMANGNNTDNVEKELLENIHEKWLLNAHHWLVLHGRYVCKAKKPECHRCQINQFCKHYESLS